MTPNKGAAANYPHEATMSPCGKLKCLSMSLSVSKKPLDRRLLDQSVPADPHPGDALLAEHSLNRAVMQMEYLRQIPDAVRSDRRRNIRLIRPGCDERTFRELAFRSLDFSRQPADYPLDLLPVIAAISKNILPQRSQERVYDFVIDDQGGYRFACCQCCIWAYNTRDEGSHFPGFRSFGLPLRTEDMAPLLGLLSLLCGYGFLVVMPVVVASLAWQNRRIKKLSTGLLAAVVMLLVFYVSAGLIWTLGTRDWNLSFLTTLDATVNAKKYGHPVESRAERMIVWLLLYSTMAAVFAGAVTAAARHSWIKRQRARRLRGTRVRDNPVM